MTVKTKAFGQSVHFCAHVEAQDFFSLLFFLNKSEFLSEARPKL